MTGALSLRKCLKIKNLQNLPSRDKQYALKNMFMPPEGAILCATDFSFSMRAPASNGQDAYSVELLEA